MTDKKVEALVAVWKERLRLNEWRIGIEFSSSSDEDCYAEAKPSKHYDAADLTFYRKRMNELDEYEVEVTVVHELLHLAHRDVEHIVDLLDDVLVADVAQIFGDAMKHVSEAFIDRQARVLVAAYAS